MEMKLKDGIIAKGICRIIEHTFRKKYGFKPIIFLDELDIHGDENVTHIILKAEANIDTKDLNKLMILLSKS